MPSGPASWNPGRAPPQPYPPPRRASIRTWYDHAGLWPTVQAHREEGQGILRATTLFFDVGDTLTYISTPLAELFARLIAEVPLRVDLHAYSSAHQEANRVFGPRLYEYLGRVDQFWLEFNRFILARIGVSDPEDRLARSINQWFRTVEPEVFHAFPESAGVLEELKEDYSLHVISNATEEVLRRLERVGLAGYFDTVTFSQEAGAEKPDAAPFRLALRRAGCRPEEAVHVGNDYGCDVGGARGVGMLPILIDRGDLFAEADCLRIRSLRELRPLLDRL